MSGGFFNYAEHSIEDVARTIISRAEKPLHKAFGKLLLKIANAVRELDREWSGDNGPGYADTALRTVVAKQMELYTVLEDAKEITKQLGEVINGVEQIMKNKKE